MDMLQLRSKETLDHGDRGWLKARHHFVVSHANMEIVTYVRQGAVTHEDSVGNVGRTIAGDVQVMSAGTGISHSEQNRDGDPLKLFQIWLRPRQDGGTPRDLKELQRIAVAVL